MTHFDRRNILNSKKIKISRLQIPKSKVVLFGTFSKIESKIRKISKFQNNIKIALVNEIIRNLRQMKDLGLNFQEKLKKIIFDNFCTFYSTLNIDQIGIFEIFEKSKICCDFKNCELLQKLFFSKMFFWKLESVTRLKNSWVRFLIFALDQKLKFGM